MANYIDVWSRATVAINNKKKMADMFAFEGNLLVTAALVTVILGFLFGHLLSRFAFWNVPRLGENSGKFDSCTSSECARCSRGSTGLLREAGRRLDAYINKDEHGEDDGLSTLKESVRGRNFEEEPSSTGGSIREAQKPVVFQMVGLRDKPWWDCDDFADTGILAANFDTVYAEFSAVRNDSLGWERNSTPTGNWSVFYIINQGEIINANAELCRETLKILSSLPLLMKNIIFGNAAFSVISPGTLIAGHYGSTNIRMRCHLGFPRTYVNDCLASRIGHTSTDRGVACGVGLDVPPRCTLTVAGESRPWKQRNCIVFDDSFLHSAHHNGCLDDNSRAVLLVDLWHPDISAKEQKALEFIFPSVQ